MMKLIGASVLAFFLFLVVLPLAGALFTLILRVGLPYLLVPTIVAGFLAELISWSHAWWTGILLALAWAVLLQMARVVIRRGEPDLAWHEGHYRAVFFILTLGIPFRARGIPKEGAVEVVNCQFEG